MAQIIAYIEYTITNAVAKLYFHGATRLLILRLSATLFLLIFHHRVKLITERCELLLGLQWDVSSPKFLSVSRLRDFGACLIAQLEIATYVIDKPFLYEAAIHVDETFATSTTFYFFIQRLVGTND